MSLPRTPPVAVTVVGGGRSCEHEVSLASARSVAEGLRAAGYDVRELTIGRCGTWSDAAGPLGPSVATSLAAALQLAEDSVWFPLLHGPDGEDGTLAALARLHGAPLVGSGIGAGAIAMDKWATKLVAEAVGVATAPGVLVRRGDPTPPWSGPAVVKPVAAGSSHGVTLAASPADLPAALATALRLDDRALVEQVVTGREVDVAVLRRADGTLVVAPALEVLGEGIFDTAAKYDGSARFQVPADLDAALAARLEAAATRVYTALGCAGLARVDFFVTPAGDLVLNEVNTVPGMTEYSQAPRMFAAAGWSYPELLAELVRTAA